MRNTSAFEERSKQFKEAAKRSPKSSTAPSTSASRDIATLIDRGSMTTGKLKKYDGHALKLKEDDAKALCHYWTSRTGGVLDEHDLAVLQLLFQCTRADSETDEYDEGDERTRSNVGILLRCDVSRIISQLLHDESKRASTKERSSEKLTFLLRITDGLLMTFEEGDAARETLATMLMAQPSETKKKKKRRGSVKNMNGVLALIKIAESDAYADRIITACLDLVNDIVTSVKTKKKLKMMMGLKDATAELARFFVASAVPSLQLQMHDTLAYILRAGALPSATALVETEITLLGSTKLITVKDAMKNPKNINSDARAVQIVRALNELASDDDMSVVPRVSTQTIHAVHLYNSENEVVMKPLTFFFARNGLYLALDEHGVVNTRIKKPNHEALHLEWSSIASCEFTSDRARSCKITLHEERRDAITEWQQIKNPVVFRGLRLELANPAVFRQFRQEFAEMTETTIASIDDADIDDDESRHSIAMLTKALRSASSSSSSSQSHSQVKTKSSRSAARSRAAAAVEEDGASQRVSDPGNARVMVAKMWQGKPIPETQDSEQQDQEDESQLSNMAVSGSVMDFDETQVTMDFDQTQTQTQAGGGGTVVVPAKEADLPGEKVVEAKAKAAVSSTAPKPAKQDKVPGASKKKKKKTKKTKKPAPVKKKKKVVVATKSALTKKTSVKSKSKEAAKTKLKPKKKQVCDFESSSSDSDKVSATNDDDDEFNAPQQQQEQEQEVASKTKKVAKKSSAKTKAKAAAAATAAAAAEKKKQKQKQKQKKKKKQKSVPVQEHANSDFDSDDDDQLVTATAAAAAAQTRYPTRRRAATKTQPPMYRDLSHSDVDEELELGEQIVAIDREHARRNTDEKKKTTTTTKKKKTKTKTKKKTKKKKTTKTKTTKKKTEEVEEKVEGKIKGKGKKTREVKTMSTGGLKSRKRGRSDGDNPVSIGNGLSPDRSDKKTQNSVALTGRDIHASSGSLRLDKVLSKVAGTVTLDSTSTSKSKKSKAKSNSKSAVAAKPKPKAYVVYDEGSSSSDESDDDGSSDDEDQRDEKALPVIHAKLAPRLNPGEERAKKQRLSPARSRSASAKLPQLHEMTSPQSDNSMNSPSGEGAGGSDGISNVERRSRSPAPRTHRNASGVSPSSLSFSSSKTSGIDSAALRMTLAKSLHHLELAESAEITRRMKERLSAPEAAFQRALGSVPKGPGAGASNKRKREAQKKMKRSVKAYARAAHALELETARFYERNAPDIARLKVLSGEMLEHNRMMAKHQSSFEENNELVQTASKRAAVASESLQTELRKHDRKSKKKTAAATALFARF